MIERYFIFLASIIVVSCQKEEKQVEACIDEQAISNTNAIEGYADKISYFPGEKVSLFIHSNKDIYDIQLISLNNPLDKIVAFDGIRGKKQNYTTCSFAKGCFWDKSFEYTLPTDLPSGYYSFDLIEDGIKVSAISFIVKAKNDKNRIVVLASTNTWQAYNSWGGASFYKYNYEHPQNISSSPLISTQRPNPSMGTRDSSLHLLGRELEVVKWLALNNYKHDVIADLDLHESFESISSTKVLILNTHPEYWSGRMRSNLERWLSKGGYLLYLGGNGIYWKITIKNGQLEVRKEGDRIHEHDGSAGGKWRDLEKQESAILGVEYDRGGYNTYYPYKVQLKEHWVFEGCEIGEDGLFGVTGSVNGASGMETDKITDCSPKTMQVLAIGLNKEAYDEIGKEDANKRGGAFMVYYNHPGGGAVFSVGSIAFGSFLNTDPNIGRITKNVLDKFLLGN